MVSSEQNIEAWYLDWFNSPYYHILYKERDEKEAERFLDNLVDHLKIPEKARILDLACGRGRHSIYLNKKGFDVTGVDLATESIKYASSFENLTLSFYEHDMRLPLRINYFDYILNLFTSFGYFSAKENQKVIDSVALGLRVSGKFVLDFMNVDKVLRTLVAREIKTVENIEFHISRYIENNTIIKEIIFMDNGIQRKYKEMVKIVYEVDIRNYFERARLVVTDVFGDYELNAFDKVNSDRLILISEKKKA